MSAEEKPSLEGAEPDIVDIPTSVGPGRAYVSEPPGAVRGTVVVGHGAGKGVTTPDLQLLSGELPSDGWRVILFDQPWVIAGKRVASPPKTLDVAWREAVELLRQQGALTPKLIFGGRSAGARVACRTAFELGADAVLALAFPLVPPGKIETPQKWRTSEALGVVGAGLPLGIIQGATDAFGRPEFLRKHLPAVSVMAVEGAHGFSKTPLDVVAAARRWLNERA